MIFLQEKCDVYSFGILLLEMSLTHGNTKDLLFEGKSAHAVMAVVAAKWAPTPEPSFAAAFPGISRIIAACLSSNPQQRPTISEVHGDLTRNII